MLLLLKILSHHFNIDIQHSKNAEMKYLLVNLEKMDILNKIKRLMSLMDVYFMNIRNVINLKLLTIENRNNGTHLFISILWCYNLLNYQNVP